ncbi:hypothetical protein CHH53_16255 [Terribacillus sp. 7520-G]|nr:hypothetical protein CHH53_16255 [Terribacillus sp. 7520-G]
MNFQIMEAGNNDSWMDCVPTCTSCPRGIAVTIGMFPYKYFWILQVERFMMEMPMEVWIVPGLNSFPFDEFPN